MTFAQPLCIYRGQSHTGIGEGSGCSTMRGEQYLKADSPLDQDGRLLEAIRPWMSLDLDPVDVQRLQDRLESWSYFRHHDFVFVARLVSAGKFDQRIAYFAHGRAWRSQALETINPAIFFGDSDSFESPWRDDDPGLRVPLSTSEFLSLENVRHEIETAIKFYGYLLQTTLQNKPLTIAAPLKDFAAESPLASLIAFIHAILPYDFPFGVRMYTRNPEVFLLYQKARLVVIPDTIASKTLGQVRDATLLDRKGDRKAGDSLTEGFWAFAESVVQRVLNDPNLLKLNWLQSFRRYLSTSGFNLNLTQQDAVKLVEHAQKQTYILCRYIEKPDEIINLYLLDNTTQGLTEIAEIEISRYLQNRKAPLDPSYWVDPYLNAWFQAPNREKLQRLLQLLKHEPRLIYDRASAASLVYAVNPSDAIDWLLSGRQLSESPLDTLLQLELIEFQSDKVSRWKNETELLASFASLQHAYFNALIEHTAQGNLTPEWIDRYGQANEAVQTVRRFLTIPYFFTRWKTILARQLERILSLSETPNDLKPLILSVYDNGWLALDKDKNPEESLVTAMSLAELVARINRQNNVNEPNRALDALLNSQSLAQLRDENLQRYVVDKFIDDNWVAFEPDALNRLITPLTLTAPKRLSATESQKTAPKPSPRWIARYADDFVQGIDKLERLFAESLIYLAKNAKQQESLALVSQEIDQRMRRDYENTIAALIQSHWHFQWLIRSNLAREAEARETIALTWLKCPLWQHWNNYKTLPEPPLESWKMAIAFLSESGLTDETMKTLTEQDASARWPWITPFEREQLDGLARLAQDVGCLVLLTQAIRQFRGLAYLPEPLETIDRYIVKQSRFQDKLPENALRYLLDERQMENNPLGITLEQSCYLYVNAGLVYQEKAKDVRIKSILYRLAKDPLALDHAKEPDLWQDPAFINALARWTLQKRSINALSHETWATINQAIQERCTQSASIALDRQARDFVSELATNHYDRIAALIDPNFNMMVYTVIRALCEGDSTAPCWDALVEQILRPSGEHPLKLIAESFLQDNRLTNEELSACWKTLKAVLQSRCELLTTNKRNEYDLPAFHLAAALCGNGALSVAASGLIVAAKESYYIQQKAWWTALLFTVYQYKRYGVLQSADDCVEQAMQAIYGTIRDEIDFTRSQLEAIREIWNNLLPYLIND